MARHPPRLLPRLCEQALPRRRRSHARARAGARSPPDLRRCPPTSHELTPISPRAPPGLHLSSPDPLRSPTTSPQSRPHLAPISPRARAGPRAGRVTDERWRWRRRQPRAASPAARRRWRRRRGAAARTARRKSGQIAAYTSLHAERRALAAARAAAAARPAAAAAHAAGAAARLQRRG